MRIEIAEIENRNVYRVWHDGKVIVASAGTGSPADPDRKGSLPCRWKCLMMLGNRSMGTPIRFSGSSEHATYARTARPPGINVFGLAKTLVPLRRWPGRPAEARRVAFLSGAFACAAVEAL